MGTTLTGISGSLRRDSLNTRLLHSAKQRMPPGSQLAIYSIQDIPLYNYDVEQADGIPAPVNDLKEAIVAGDGLLIVTPEYNNSLPGVLKNAIDWLSRPADDAARIFRDRPLAIMGASPGAFGTLLAQNALLPVIRTLGLRHWAAGRLLAPRAPHLFDDNGDLQDEAMDQRLHQFMEGFVEFVKQQRQTS